jgi:hypothetical protein
MIGAACNSRFPQAKEGGITGGSLYSTVVYIRSGANLAHFFRKMPIKKIMKKNAKFLTVRLVIIGLYMTLYFAGHLFLLRSSLFSILEVCSGLPSDVLRN